MSYAYLFVVLILSKVLLEWVMQEFQRKEGECKIILVLCVREFSIFVHFLMQSKVSLEWVSGRRVSAGKFIKMLCVCVCVCVCV